MNKLLAKGGTIFDYIIGSLTYLAAAILTFIMLAVVWDVIARAVASQPLRWVLEFSEYSLLYITFLGTAWVLKLERHVIVDIGLNQFGLKTRALLNVATSILGAIICAILAWYGWDVAWEHLVKGFYQPTVIRPPDFPIFVIIPIGSFLLSIQFLRRANKHLGDWRKFRDQE